MPADPVTKFFTLGYALQESGRPQEAIAAFESALRLDPAYVPERVGLAELRR